MTLITGFKKTGDSSVGPFEMSALKSINSLNTFYQVLPMHISSLKSYATKTTALRVPPVNRKAPMSKTETLLLYTGHFRCLLTTMNTT